MFQDLVFSLRLILKERWFTLMVVLVLALGIGVNATGFTIVNGAFLRGPAFANSRQLFMLSWQPRGGQRSNISYPELQDWRAQSRAFEGIAAFYNRKMNISDEHAAPQQAEGSALTTNAFPVLRQQTFIGRDFAPGEDSKSAAPVVILSHRLWQNRYGGDPQVLGASLRVDGQASTIIGVMPDKMNFPINADFWIPLRPTAAQEPRNARVLQAFGRLREGATLRQAQTEFDGIAHRLQTAYPETNGDLVGGRIETFTQRFVGGPARVMFAAIMAAGAFVLLIACANVANLLLSRSAQRAREMSMRIALGASRWRVIRLLLMESVVRACLGGAAGAILALAGVRALDDVMTDPGKPYWIVFTMDYAVLGYVATICVLTGILFGLAPALHISKANINDLMKQGGRGSTVGRRMRVFSGTMVIVELALTVVLLAGAGLIIRSFLNLYTLDIGIRTENLMTTRVELPFSRYATPEDRRSFYQRLRSQVSATPGVQSIAVSSYVPGLGSEFRPFTIEGRPPRSGGPADQQAPQAAAVAISPEFFAVTGVLVRLGRTFNEEDGAPGAENVIINERMATLFFPGEDALGHRLRFNDQDAWRTIVGVIPSTLHDWQHDAPAPVIYAPYRQDSRGSAWLVMRSTLPPSTVLNAVRRAVQAIDRDQPVSAIATVDHMLEEARWGLRTFGSVFAIFAAVALVLSTVGLYAVMAYTVAQRTQEIGIRMALGARSHEISRLILKRGAAQILVGLASGLAGALSLSTALRRLLVRIHPADPLTFTAIIFLMTAVAAIACLIPARRAARIDPLVAIREE